MSRGSAGGQQTRGGPGGIDASSSVGGADTDEKAKVSADDTTAGYLFSKFAVAGGIVKAETNPGGNETLTLTGYPLTIETITVGADAQTVTFSNLDGETDGIYEIFGYIIAGGTTGQYALRPNSLTTNQAARRIVGAGTTGSSDALSILSLGSSALNQFVGLRAVFMAKTGRKRVLLSQYFHGPGAAVDAGVVASSIWNEAVTPVTSLEIVGDYATAIKAGSVFVLRKLGVTAL